MDATLEQKIEPQVSKSPPVNERKTVFLLCLLAAIHVFVYSAAFPTFNINDETSHFDLVLKYSQGDVPKEMSPMSEEWMRYYALFSTAEYFYTPDMLPDKKYEPPPWSLPLEQAKGILFSREVAWRTLNHESSQPPLYYVLAGGWWRLGQLCGFHDGYLLYWVRFLDVVLVAGLVWLGYAAAKIAFPERPFLRLGVPALLAVMPQTVFYSVTNDILSPLCFGWAFICLMQWWNADRLKARHGIALGTALAATFLTKMCNLPFIGVVALFLVVDGWHQLNGGKLRSSFLAWICLILCAEPPMIWWGNRCQRGFGDFTGSEVKIRLLGWTHKQVPEWFHHPIFSPDGLWIFFHDLMASFWRGEFLWHRKPLASPPVDMVYVLVSLGLIILAVVNLCSKSSRPPIPERRALWFCLCAMLATIGFLGFLSIIYDFHKCFYPSSEHPYFTSGRLMLGALIPFLLLFLHGLDGAFKNVNNRRARALVLAGMMIFMLATEAAIDRPVFFSRYNWFHLAG